MPTVLRLDRYRFYLYSREPNEPPHIHVEWGNRLAKFWLEPVKLPRRGDFATTSYALSAFLC
jgi:hypothetical protein